MKNFWSFLVGMAVASALTVPVLSAMAGGHGQASNPEYGAKSDQVLAKLRRIDLLNRIVPLLLNKEQLSKLLDAVDKARQNMRKEEEFEYKTLIGMEPKIDAVLDKAMDKVDAPGQAPVKEFGSTINTLFDTRAIVLKDNENSVYDALWPLLDKGQKKALAGTINPRDIDPKLKIEDIKDEEMVRFCIRDTLLDPLAYPILVKLLKQASDK